MIKSYLKVAARTIRKQKVFASINIVGLAVALACSLLILFHVKDELNYERSFPKADQIHRVTSYTKYGDSFIHWALGSVPLGPLMAAEVPEIEQVARFRRIHSTVLSHTPDRGDVKRFRETGGFYADASAIEMFDLNFTDGDRETALNGVDRIIITESTAERYFGQDNPIGRTLLSDAEGRLYQVTGVIEDLPQSTHLQYDFLISMDTWFEVRDERSLNSRTWKALFTYVILDDQHDRGDVESKIADFQKLSFHRDNPDRVESFFLQPITDIHLHSKLSEELAPNSDILYVYIFAVSGLLLLLIAIVNFVNLTAAQTLRRMQEVGVRKAIGAHRRQLVYQFLGESFLQVLLASGLGFFLFSLALPFYNSLSGKQFSFLELLSLDNMLLVVAIVLVTGIIAGLYPAFFVSRFGPMEALKGQMTPGTSSSVFRKSLVVFQFAISVFLITSTITIYKQLVFLHEKDLGFDQEQLIAVNVYGDDIIGNVDALKGELLSHAAITHVTLATDVPGESISLDRFRPHSIPADAPLPLLAMFWVSEDFLETMDIELVEGRSFRKETSDEEQFMISETAVEILGVVDPIGQKASGYSPEGEIVGVFKDFHFASLHDTIEPLVLIYKPDPTPFMFVRTEGANTADVLAFMQTRFQDLSPGYVFDYEFLDDKLNHLYVAEDRLEQIFRFFSGIALLIACLGLFGLSVFAAELRRKEIGVRKVMGATVWGISGLLSKGFLLLVGLAIVLALPLAYFSLQAWLEGFAFRLEMEMSTFVISAMASIIISLLTISYQSIKAARANPIDSLRYE